MSGSDSAAAAGSPASRARAPRRPSGSDSAAAAAGSPASAPAPSGSDSAAARAALRCTSPTSASSIDSGRTSATSRSVTTPTSRQRLVLLIGRHSSITTRSPTVARFSGSCTG